MTRVLIGILFTAFLVGSAGAGDKPLEADGADTIPEFDCVIEPSEIIDVGSAVPGLIKAIYAHRSDLVKKGEVIAQLESSVERATLKLSKVRAKLTTSIELRQASAAFERRTQKRNQVLFQKSSLSEYDMDRLKTETRIAQLQVRQEKDNKRIAGLEYGSAAATLARRTIRSPVQGVVMERFKSVGEYVDEDPILRVAQLDPLHVEVIVPVKYLGRITPGMQAEVTPVVSSHNIHLATVTRVDRVADAASGTFGVRLSLSNPDYTIPGGLRCRLGFLPAEAPAAPVTAAESVEDKGDPTRTALAAGE
ncbi:MAG: efflux RND transporter periplasmic adaptor subunit [Gammaproteobacteria bacterium]|nr:efflux RND transporter periplasmic adaptor subunit [Gammaproteobacteria bacterium]